MPLRVWLFGSVVICSCATAAARGGERPLYDPALFGAMQWRLVGPFRGGRVLAAQGVSGQPHVYYFGAASGGVWRSSDNGSSWQPLFDHEPVSSIGALAVAPSDPNILYVGSGEACIRGNISYGNGVYRSVDAGRTWTHLGLSDTRHIGAIVVHPRDPDVVLVAALGHAFGPNRERGVFRTTDGGRSWHKVLYRDENTGAIDLAADPQNPNVVWAALWQVRRQPWNLSSGGPGSGLYRSQDGGVSWTRVTGGGLPAGLWGRVGIAISGADSSRIYAAIEAREGGLFRSDDGGRHFVRTNQDDRFRQRAWYFSHVVADPKSPDTVYVLNTGLFRSNDGGRTFELLPARHGDHHVLWIDPSDPRRMINGNDGGASVSVDGGKSWSEQNNQPTAQFYHVATDDVFPYRLYGAQQDNSTVAIASRGETGVIDEKDWEVLAGGESGYVAPDPRDPHVVFAGGYTGYVTRFDRRTQQGQDVSMLPLDVSGHAAAVLAHRFGWTEPLFFSPHDPRVLWAAGESVWRTSDAGRSWTEVSGDLTRNDKSKQQPSGGPITLDITSVEYYDTVFALAESPLQKDLVWAGTDDGLVHLTRDGGRRWDNVTPRALSPWSLVSIIEPGRHAAGTAYLAVDRHKLDDLRPYVYRTTDYGRSWTFIAQGLPQTSCVHVVREDPRRRGLLYAGTETGVWVSLDDGAHWQPLQLNLPTVPVHDLAIKGDDLLAATHGRAFWILDGITPLRQLDAALARRDVILYAPPETVRVRLPDSVERRRPVGQNPPKGAIIDYFLRTAPEGEVVLQIFDPQNRRVRRLSSRPDDVAEQPPEWPDQEKPADRLPAQAGMNRFAWDLRWDDPVKIPGAFYEGNGPRGPIVLPGRYRLELHVGGQVQQATLTVRADPRVKTPREDLEAQHQLALALRDRIQALHVAVNQIRATRAQLELVRARLVEAPSDAARQTLGAADALDRGMSAVERQLIQVDMKSSEGNLGFPSMLNEQLDAFSASLEQSDDAPTQAMRAQFARFQARLEGELGKWKQLVAREVPSLNRLAQSADVARVDPTLERFPRQKAVAK
jgi:photosystem II stability/assembly factor-like uncharacterized protein